MVFPLRSCPAILPPIPTISQHQIFTVASSSSALFSIYFGASPLRNTNAPHRGLTSVYMISRYTLFQVLLPDNTPTRHDQSRIFFLKFPKIPNFSTVFTTFPKFPVVLNFTLWFCAFRLKFLAFPGHESRATGHGSRGLSARRDQTRR